MPEIAPPTPRPIDIGTVLGGRVDLPRSEVTTGNHMQLFMGEGEYLGPLLRDLAGAQHSVDVVQFNWEPDGSGAQVASALAGLGPGVERHAQMDAYGTAQAGLARSTRFVSSMRGDGIDVRRSWRVGVGGGLGPKGNAPRGWEHRKIYVIDDRVAYIGGLGLGTMYHDWSDFMVRLEGPIAAHVGAEAVASWVDLGGKVSARRQAQLGTALRAADAAAKGADLALGRERSATPVADAAAGAQLLVNWPHLDPGASDGFRHDAAAARRRLWLTTPYIGTEEVAKLVAAAADKGVDTRVVVPGLSSGRNRKELLVSRSFYPELIRHGVQIYELPTMMHGKARLADDTASVGSMNLSKNSMYNCAENTVRTNDPTLVKDLEQRYLELQSQATPVTMESVSNPLNRVVGFIRRHTGLHF